MQTYRIPGVDNCDRFGRWAFVQLHDVYDMESGVERQFESYLKEMIYKAASVAECAA